jgi:hypothetical protein
MGVTLPRKWDTALPGFDPHMGIALFHFMRDVARDCLDHFLGAFIDG